MTAPFKTSRLVLSLQTWAADVREGFVEITRHSLAVVGLAVVLVGVTFLARPGLQVAASEILLGWLELRMVDVSDTIETANAASRTTTQNPKTPSPEQLTVTRWLGRRYRVANEPLAAMVSQAWALGERSQLSPTLILAIVGVESRFNPFATGSQGTVGLMQIDPDAHAEALQQFGGPLAAFDPLTNLRLGVRHLQGLVQLSNDVDEALALYGASSGQANESRYVERVLAEQRLIDKLIEKSSPGARLGKDNAPRG